MTGLPSLAISSLIRALVRNPSATSRMISAPRINLKLFLVIVVEIAI
jgi:hypothetical protein